MDTCSIYLVYIQHAFRKICFNVIDVCIFVLIVGLG